MDGSPKFLQDYTSKSVEFICGHSIPLNVQDLLLPFKEFKL
jgi:hypothetical protein